MPPSLPPDGALCPQAKRERSETGPAAARFWLAAIMLVLAFVDDRETSARLALVAAAGAYLVFAALVRVLQRFIHGDRRLVTPVPHAVDVMAAAAMMLAGTGSPTVLIVGFVLFAAAWRWGFAGAIATAAGTAALHLGQAVIVPLLAEGPHAAPTGTPVDESMLVRTAYLLVAGVVVGGLAQMHKEHPSEAVVIADVASRLDMRLGFAAAVGSALHALLRMFDAKRAVLVTHDKENGGVWLWCTRRSTERADGESVERTRLDASAAATYLSVPAGVGFHLTRQGLPRQQFDMVWVGVTGRNTPPQLADALMKAEGPFDDIMSAGVEIPGEWTARVFLMDPRIARDRTGAVALLHGVVRGLARPLHNVYLLRRVRGRSVADERARISRELHDSIVQSILGVQVQLHALALQASEVHRELALDINQLGLTLREEVLRLREMMQQMKPIAPDPDHLMDTIAGLIRRFETETGIRTRFVTCSDRVPLLPPACLEVLRIVQESLVNVRRHSGATNVLIRFTVENPACHLTIDDDGRGFTFSGRLSMQELDRTLQGPWVIKDRVRRLGGDISVESVPGRGSRLEIKIPISTYAFHG